MNIAVYEKIIDQWSGATGMAPWSAKDSIYIDINNTTIALIYDEEVAPEQLNAYFDLGFLETPGIHEKLLKQNMLIETGRRGYFGINPESGGILYRLEIPLSEATDGAQLPHYLESMLEHTKQLLQS